MGKIRTLAEFPFQFNFHPVEKRPLYQEIATVVLHPKQLGLNTSTFARSLNVGYKTVIKSVN